MCTDLKYVQKSSFLANQKLIPSVMVHLYFSELMKHNTFLTNSIDFTVILQDTYCSSVSHWPPSRNATQGIVEHLLSIDVLASVFYSTQQVTTSTFVQFRPDQIVQLCSNNPINLFRICFILVTSIVVRYLEPAHDHFCRRFYSCFGTLGFPWIATFQMIVNKRVLTSTLVA